MKYPDPHVITEAGVVIGRVEIRGMNYYATSVQGKVVARFRAYDDAKAYLTTCAARSEPKV